MYQGPKQANLTDGNRSQESVYSWGMEIRKEYTEGALPMLWRKLKAYPTSSTFYFFMHQTIFLGSKIIADGDCSHEIKGCFLLGRKAMTNLDSILKTRDITSPTKVHLVKAMVFPVVKYGCESWTIKKAEH